MRSVAAVATVLVAAAAVAPAVAEARFSVSPTLIHVDRQPGKAASGTFDVRLGGESGRKFSVEVQDIVQSPDGSTSYAPPSDSPFSASSWVTVSPRHFKGGPNRTQPVQYSIRVPPKAPPGDHVTSLTVTRHPEKSDAVAETVQAVSVRLTVHVFGRARPAAEITSFEAPGLSGGSPVEVSAVVENTGNITLDFDGKPSGSIAIRSDDETMAEEQFTGELFPGQSHRFELAWDAPPLFGQFQAVATVDVGGDEDPDSESKSVVQVPWRQIAAIVLIVLAVSVLVVGRRRGRY